MGYVENLQNAIEEHQRIIDAGLPEAAEAQQIINRLSGDLAAATGGGGGGDVTPYNYDTDPETMRMREAQRAEDARRAAEEKFRQENAIATMKALLESYNLTSLYDRVVNFIREGYDAEAVSVLIRTTPEYKQRFPAMEALARKGRAISEAAYISYEQTASGLERRYGLPANMLMGNVTKLLENEVSPDELNDRVVLAAAASIQAPEEIKQSLYQFYNIDSGGLTAYFLDPAIATPLLEKRYATAQIGAEAMRQNVGIDVEIAENLQELGVTTEQAQQGFATVAAQRGLTEGRGDVVTQRQQVKAVLGQDVSAQRDVERAAAARVGRFSGGGEILRTEKGAVGLGSAATR